jgi:hypothetical protein
VSTLLTIYLVHKGNVCTAFPRVSNNRAKILEILVLSLGGMESVFGVVVHEDKPIYRNAACGPTITHRILNHFIDVRQHINHTVFVLRATPKHAILYIPKNVCATRPTPEHFLHGKDSITPRI